MTKGGYQILDFSNYNFNKGITLYIPNIYEKIEGTRKVILISGLTVDGKEYRDAFVDFDVDEGNFVGEMYDIKITIGASVDGNDTVTITINEGV